MNDQGFPGQVTTTRTQTTTVISPAIRFDHSYVRTIPGILKVVQIVLALCGFISASVAYGRYSATANWYGFVSMTGFIVTLILLLSYLFHIIEKLHKIPWLPAEFIYCAVWAFFYLTAGAACAGSATGDSGFGAAAFFGFANLVAYGVDAYLKYKAWKAGEIAQGERSISKTISTTSPAY